jgi:regulator of protease activity HflC (stomatin/prohibitin superfamily)
LTLRFRIDVAALQMIHTRLGNEGYWSAVRDVSESTIIRVLATVDVDALYGARRAELNAELTEALTADLAELGFVVTMFDLVDIDLGQTSAVMEATARARHELAREQAEAAMRLVRSQIDADLAPYARAGSEVALRYREIDSLRELARASNVVVPVSHRPVAESPVAEPEAPLAAVEEQA